MATGTDRRTDRIHTYPYPLPGDAFCRYSQPVARGFQAVTWWGQLLLAWATWDTIRGGKRMGPKTVSDARIEP